MAVTPVGQPVAAIKSATSSANFTSFSPNAGSGYIVSVGLATNQSAVASSTVAWASGGSGTWAKLKSTIADQFQPTGEIWWVHCTTAPGSSQISVTGNAAVSGVFATVEEVTGHHTTTQNGATAQSNNTPFNTITTTPNQTGSRIFHVFVDQNDGVTGTANGSSTLLDQWNNSGQTNCSLISNSSTTASSPVTTGITNTLTANEQVSVEIVPAPAAAAAATVMPANPGATWRRRFQHRQTPQLPAVAASIALGDDTAAGADAVTVTAAVPLADTGTGADALTVTVAVPLADTAAAADAVTITAAVPLTDSGSAADAISVNTGGNPSLPDTAAAADAVTVTATLPLTDTATAADTLTVSVAVTLTDTGTAADTFTAVRVLTLADTATGSDTLTATAAVPFAETAVASDAIVVAGAGVPVPPFTVTASDRSAVDVTGVSTPAATITATDAPAVNVTSTSTP